MTSLTFDDAVDVWLRHWHREFQHKIAASYGVNQGRINEVLKEKIHIGSKQIAASRRSA
jgi:predicted XRE-type DNA-binding protein